MLSAERPNAGDAALDGEIDGLAETSGVTDFAGGGVGVATLIGVPNGVGLRLGTLAFESAARGLGVSCSRGLGVAVTDDVAVAAGPTEGVTSRVCLGRVAARCGAAVATGGGEGASVAVGAATGEVATDIAGEVAVAVGADGVISALACIGFTNVFGGASGGGVASDFIFSRAFLAAS